MDARIDQFHVSRQEDAYQHLDLLLESAKARGRIAEAELQLKVSEVGGERHAKDVELRIRRAEARLGVIEAEERMMLESGSHR